jgi:hypothetical protein
MSPPQITNPDKFCIPSRAFLHYVEIHKRNNFLTQCNDENLHLLCGDQIQSFKFAEHCSQK